MKKIILLVAVATTISFAACTNKTTAEQPAETVIEEATNEVEEAIEEATFENGKEDLTTNTKNNLRRTFILLYFTGMRINEVKQLKVKDINTIFEKEELIIVTHKTRKERKLFFSKEAIKLLQEYDWTGNIRELRNVVERLIILGGKEISKSDVELFASK